MSKFTVLEKAKAKLVIGDPFYGSIVLDTPNKFITDGSLKWAATDGENIYINPDEFENLPLVQAVGVLKHEAEHIARLHPWRRGTRDPEKWNEACDAIINASLEKEGNELPDGVIRDPNALQYSEEQYYAKMPDKPKGGGGGQGQPGQGQGQPGQQPSKDPMAGDVRTPPSGVNNQQAQDIAKQRVAKARQVAKARGKMPGDLDAELDELLNPKVDWKTQLERWCQEQGEDDVSWARPDRRFISQGLYLPGKHSDDAMGEFVAVFDTSMSMDDQELRQCMGESASAVKDVKPSKFVAVYCDATVQHVDSWDDPTDAEVATSFRRYGGGGTDMTEALDYVDEHYPNVAAVVVFTDGRTPYGEQRTYPVLWGITEASQLDRPPWGEKVLVEFDDD